MEQNSSKLGKPENGGNREIRSLWHVCSIISSAKTSLKINPCIAVVGEIQLFVWPRPPRIATCNYKQIGKCHIIKFIHHQLSYRIHGSRCFYEGFSVFIRPGPSRPLFHCIPFCLPWKRVFRSNKINQIKWLDRVLSEFMKYRKYAILYVINMSCESTRKRLRIYCFFDF